MFEFIKFLYNLSPAASVEIISFQHTRENKKLKAMIWKPKGPGPFPLVAFDVGLQFRIWEIPLAAKIIARTGYAVMGTEYCRIEIAKGEVRDIISGIDYAHKTFSFLNDKTLLVGISMGAATMLNIASKVGEKYNIVAVIAMAPFSDLARAYYYTQGYFQVHEKKDKRVKLLKLYQKHAFTDPVSQPKEFLVRSPINFVKNIKCPVIFIHGKKDEIVTVDHSIELYHKMKWLKKDVDLILTTGEGIHTPLTTETMLEKLNFVGFAKTWFCVHKSLKKIQKFLICD